MNKKMTVSQARAAARRLLSFTTDPDREWNLSTVASCLPNGWRLRSHLTEYDFLGPGTIKDISTTIRLGSVLASDCDAYDPRDDADAAQGEMRRDGYQKRPEHA